MNNSLHVTENFIKTVLLEYINKGIRCVILLNDTMTVLLEYIDHSLQFSTNDLILLLIFILHFQLTTWRGFEPLTSMQLSNLLLYRLDLQHTITSLVTLTSSYGPVQPTANAESAFPVQPTAQ